jgi:hypothetical protein
VLSFLFLVYVCQGDDVVIVVQLAMFDKHTQMWLLRPGAPDEAEIRSKITPEDMCMCFRTRSEIARLRAIGWLCPQLATGLPGRVSRRHSFHRLEHVLYAHQNHEA